MSPSDGKRPRTAFPPRRLACPTRRTQCGGKSSLLADQRQTFSIARKYSILFQSGQAPGLTNERRLPSLARVESPFRSSAMLEYSAFSSQRPIRAVGARHLLIIFLRGRFHRARPILPFSRGAPTRASRWSFALQCSALRGRDAAGEHQHQLVRFLSKRLNASRRFDSLAETQPNPRFLYALQHPAASSQCR